MSTSRTLTGDLQSPAIPSSLAACRLAVVGAGKLGTSLGLGLTEQGASLAGFITRTSSGAERAAALLGGTAAKDLAELSARDANVFLLTVPDGALPEVAARLAEMLASQVPIRSGKTRPIVLHTSGATPAAALKQCVEAGAVTLAFHPLQTFSDPKAVGPGLAGSFVALTEGAPGGEAFGRMIAEALGARPFILADDARTLYHAAACIASNYLVTLMHVSEQLFAQAGIPLEEALEAFSPLARRALENSFGQGPVEALTGPLGRGDVSTIQAHLGELESRAPVHLGTYRALGLATLEMVRERGEVDADTLERLRRLLDGASDGHAGGSS